MNKVILMGNLTKDPEIRYTQSAEPLCVARYTLAVAKRFKKEGEPDAEFILCRSFGKQAEFVERFLKKGMKIALVGRITTYSYEDNGQRKWVTEVIAEEVEFAESKAAFEARMAKSGGGFSNNGGPPDPFFDSLQNNPPPSQNNAPAFEPEGFSAITQSIDDDDLPF
jgi:single-strand DNA-binding protein